MKKVKIYGAGSIGNHLANASRTMGWSVDICDIDTEALKRTKEDIYPSRYGSWDEKIGLYQNHEVPKGGYDYIFIGTPPDSHISLALEALKESPKGILVEKPFCTPDLKQAQVLVDEARRKGVEIFTGYDHVAGSAVQKFAEMIKNEELGKIQTLDVEFREHWGGVFSAHPWLNGPSDTYLGFWKRGGGATGEHSHALNLWQYFSQELGAGRITDVSASIEYVKTEKVDYDSISFMNVKTEKEFIGRIVQDVVTKPTRKWARAQAENGFVEWHCGYKPGQDVVLYGLDNANVEKIVFEKTRPDDFIRELNMIESYMDSNSNFCPISMDRGLETMMVVSAAYASSIDSRRKKIDYTKGYTLDAIS